MPMERIQVLLPTEVVRFLNDKARKSVSGLSDEVRKRVLASVEVSGEMVWDENLGVWRESR